MLGPQWFLRAGDLASDLDPPTNRRLSQAFRETTSPTAVYSAPSPHSASESQRAAIEAETGPVLVLAGPGAGKTFCLIERIRFLVEKRGVEPARICAFTFTNKAAGEISSRLEKYLGTAADTIKRGTLHSFCCEILREFGTAIGLEPGFGIADEEYQVRALRRVGDFRKYPTGTLKRFTAMRFKSDPIAERVSSTALQAFLAKATCSTSTSSSFAPRPDARR